MKNNVTIISEGEFVTPASVQRKIIEDFSFKKNKEVLVKKGDKEGEYDVYQNDKYVNTYQE